MLDDLLAHLFGQAVFGRVEPSHRTQLLVRFCFGLLGAVLGIAGVVSFATRSSLPGGPALRLTVVGMFVGLVAFSLFNVALGRRWRWPGLLFVASFVAMFVVRIMVGP